jgi:two-component system, sensor histidine kinase and response regulator
MDEPVVDWEHHPGLWQALMELVSDSVFVKDLQGRYRVYNRAAAAEVGLAVGQVLGRDDLELFGPELGRRLRDNDRRVLQEGRDVALEELLDTAAGRRHKVGVKRPLRDAAGRVVGLVGVSRDTLEAQLAQRALRQSETHFRAVVSVLREGVLVADAQGRVINANPAMVAMAGLSEAEWRGRGFVPPGWTLLDAAGRPLLPEETPPGQVLTDGQARHGVLLQSLRPDGSRGWMVVGAAPVHAAEDGALVAVVTTARDVTQRQQLDEELARHRTQLEALVAARTEALSHSVRQLEDQARFVRAITDTVPGRVAYWDAGLICRFANRSYHDWFGFAPGSVVGRRVDELFPADYVQRQQPLVEAAFGGRTLVFERAAHSARGEEAVHQVHYLPDIGDDGVVRGITVMAFDITPLKRAEAELVRLNAELAQARDAAEAASRAKSAFLANMSHEIRTPMNAIIGLAHLLARDSRDTLQATRLAKVENAAQHLLGVINNILDLSKIEAGKMVLQPQEFALDPVLARCFELVADGARDKGLELVLDTDHLPPRLVGDATRLSQALINLLSNAVKFTAQGWVRLKAERLQDDGERLLVRFEVQDTGPGIAPEQLPLLFSPFEQGDGSITRSHGGTGLGLALTRHLARLMGGDTGVDSRPGEGSRFWFTARLAHARGDDSAVAPVVALRGLRALLVDDLAEARAALGERLSLLGLRVVAAADGPAALEAAQAASNAGRPFDVALLDWRMAPWDGIRTLARLRERLGEGLPPCVLVTAFDEPAMWTEARAAGVEAVLVKPITASALHDTLVRVLRTPGTGAHRPAAPGQSEALLRLRHAGQRVLLAEDNPVNQEVACELLKRAGLVVETAADGEAALARLGAARFDAVLMDVQMPRLDGLAATRALRRRFGDTLPVIAMTAHAFGEDRAACLEAGMNDHVAKPVDPERLYATLLRWLPRAAPGTAPEPSGTDTAGATLRERLAAVPGLDLEQGLRHVGGHFDTLQRALALLARQLANGEATLGRQEADAATQLAAWARSAHSLRGACATLGAVLLQQRLQAFEQALQAALAAAGTPGAALARLEAEAQALDAELQRFGRALQHALVG